MMRSSEWWKNFSFGKLWLHRKLTTHNKIFWRYVIKTAGLHDIFSLNNINLDVIKLYNKCKLSKSIDLIGGFHFDLISQPKVIIKGVNICIKLERNKNNFVVMSVFETFIFIKHTHLKLSYFQSFILRVNMLGTWISNEGNM